ncbi:MAG: sugar ABC transporter ATP-binding protein [Synergistaceae bacterium]|nr:sugar ABC transporter ATP-binding protein [Synergistaceae bacterium]
MILDEPTSSLNDEEAKMLLDLLIDFNKQGLTSIIITHKLNEIIYCADKVTIIRDGSTIETLTKGVDELSEDRIIKGMVGRPMDDRYPERSRNIKSDIALEVKDWTVHHPIYSEKTVVDHVSFNLHRGEVIGFSGLQGAGRTELAMSIFGRSYGTNITGTLTLNGNATVLKTPEAAIHSRLAYVTEDRKTNGLLLNESIRMNTTLARLDKITTRGIIDEYKEHIAAEQMKNDMGTKTPSIQQKVGTCQEATSRKRC